jgi:quercetin dioxygenase-like cupin family protein
MATMTRGTTDGSDGWRTLRNRHTGEQLRIRRVQHDGQTCLELDGSLGPHQEGPPLHIHHAESEEGIVNAGRLSAIIDGRVVTVDAGRAAVFPAGSAHRWWNADDETLHFTGLVQPLVDFDVYIESAFDVINRSPAGRPSLFYIAHLAWRHRNTQTVLFAPRWLQRVLLPAIVVIGTALGRYRGTSWPGFPASAPQAAARTAGLG